MRRALRILLVVGVVLTIALAASVSWLAFSQSAAHWLVYQLVAAFDGRLAVGAVEGSLAKGISIRDVVYRENGLRVEIDRSEARWQWSALLDFHARFRRLALGRVMVTTAPTTERSQPPASLAIPLRVSVDEGRIEQLVVVSDAQRFTVEQIDFRGAADQTRHIIDAMALRVPGGRVQGRAQIETAAPFALQAQFAYAPDADRALPSAQMTLGGNLLELHARFDTTAPWLAAAGEATISPFELVLVKHLTAKVEKMLPHERIPEALHAQLRGSIDLRQVAEDRFEGNLEVHNDAPGEFAENKVPLAGLAARLSGNVDAVDITGLELRMPHGQSFTGEGRYAAGALELALDTRALDLKAWDKRLATTRLAGSLKIAADAQSQSLSALLTQQGYRIETDVVRHADLLTVKRASAAARGGSLTLSGEIALEPPHAFAAHGKLARFDPSAFFEVPRARVNADITAKGSVTPQWSAQVAVRADGSGPRGEAFTADARALVRPQRVSDLRGRVTVGHNEVTVEGAYGAATDSLALDAKLRALNELDARFGGALEAKGRVSGDLARPQVQVEGTGSGITAPGNLRIGALQLRAALPSDWDKAIDFEALASDVQIDATRASKATVVVRGTPRSHTIEASAQGKDLDARARLAGGLTSISAWSGELAQLEVQRPTKVSLPAPARLSLAAERIEVGAFTIVAMDARLAFGQLVWTPETFRTSGEFTQLRIAPFLVPWDKTVRSTLVLTGDWVIEQRGGVLRGDVNVNRDAGDVVLMGEVALPLALTALRVEAHAENNRIRATANATSSSLGALQATIATEAVRSEAGWALPPSAPLAIEASGDFTSIAWLGPLIDPGVAISGTLSVRASGQGTVGKPRLDGAIEGKAVSIRMPAMGIALTDGEISATVVNDRVAVKALRFKGGDGVLTATGEADLGKGTSARLHVEARKLMLMNRRDAQLALDATGDIVFADGTLRLKGDAHVVQAQLDLLRKAGMPTLASDIKVRTDKPAQPPRQPMRMIIDLSIDFGDRFTVTAKGIGVGAESALKAISGDFTARIAGKVRTLSDANQIPQTTGRLNVIDGTYSMIGRRFKVERGNLNFSGPLNNPSLDIYVTAAATRLQFTPDVGISITGTAQAPRVQLVSRPDMPETEKLSWLLFGRGGQTSDYTVGSTAQLAGPVTEFGWQLSQKLYVAYEQGTTGTSNIVRFYSQLTDRIAIQLGTGDANSLFLLYTFTLK